VAGLYKGTVTGTGVTGVTFDLYADGTHEIQEQFTSAAAAKAWFTDHAFDLGSLVSGFPLGGDTLTLKAVLTVTSNSAGSGFYGDIIIGDPPRAGTTRDPALHGLIQAVAGFSAERSAASASEGSLHGVEAGESRLLAASAHVHLA